MNPSTVQPIESLSGWSLFGFAILSLVFLMGGLALAFGRDAKTKERNFHPLGLVFIPMGLGGLIFSIETAIGLSSGIGLKLFIVCVSLMGCLAGLSSIVLLPAFKKSVSSAPSEQNNSPEHRKGERIGVIGYTLGGMSFLAWIIAIGTLFYWAYLLFFGAEDATRTFAEKWLGTSMEWGFAMTIMIWGYVLFRCEKYFIGILLLAAGFGTLALATDATFGTAIAVLFAPIYWLLELLGLVTSAAEHGLGLFVWVALTWFIISGLVAERAWLAGLITGAVIVLYILFGPAPAKEYYEPFEKIYKHLIIESDETPFKLEIHQ